MTAPAVALVMALDGGLVAPHDLALERMAAHLSAGHFATAFSTLSGAMDADGLKTVARTLPLRGEALTVMETAVAQGRPIYLLASKALKPLADLIAQRLRTIAGVLVLSETGDSIAAALAARGAHPEFDYLDDAGSPSAAWAAARRGFAVGMTQATARHFDQQRLAVAAISGRTSGWKDRLRLLRPHQYAKNLLVFVPMLTSHELNLPTLLTALIAFACFSLAASAVYVVNDFIDMHADRAHPSKKRRPFAAATVPLRQGLAMVPLLLLASAGLAFQLPPLFAALLGLYLLATTAYSFALKKMMLVDVTVLSLLYSLRVVAGAAAIGVDVSEWLFAFSLMIFTALALTKRYVELSDRLDRDMPDPSNRDYKITDLPIIAALAAAAGMNAVTVLALYVNSDTVRRLYSHPALLWLLCPIFLYWTGRVLLLAHRRQLHDDPIVFALTDVRSWLVGAGMITTVALAM